MNGVKHKEMRRGYRRCAPFPDRSLISQEAATEVGREVTGCYEVISIKMDRASAAINALL
jgi:hypothetical protein